MFRLQQVHSVCVYLETHWGVNTGVGLQKAEVETTPSPNADVTL